MASLNRVMLIGRLGRDPELRYTQSGQPVTNFRMATDESYTNQQGERVDRAEWHSVVVFGRQAEPCANYLHKGSLVYVEGSLQTRKWQAQDGSDRYTTEVKAMRVQFLDPKGAQPQGGQQPRQQQNNGGGWGGQQQAQNQQQSSSEDLGPAFPSEASGMDDVPF
ncbi:single-stranded DNA-binding protein [Desulfobaculum bizertense]|uniref:Single-stranded DNA-binding protein n=1 Tax=Desulfobaculum bizertense DSM 18034 TaxID=1121442 RepID=A0A1T4W8D3_9BACT|nr:single-stranded DNA-binding protein [Desulfobaculum bizertense]UIJ39191.1 single-stranded DNA-binding protein [Desulfobaculum bizertense]SKA73542.1 single-strand binding protein [Desulfobaculum bizertense DSM 18034]